jgi:tripartite-type tricarboxylate transporter receptor subunit TctC
VSRKAAADDYPSRPVRVLVGFPAGGTTDIIARLIGQPLTERFGQPFITDNRPGANTNIAASTLAHAAPDGHTLMIIGATNTINASLYTNLNFDLVRDFAMVAGVTQTPMVLEIIPSLPVTTVPEFIAYAKANPGKVNLASFGAGTLSHVVGELFKLNAGIDLLHVPYRGSAPMVTDLLGAQVEAAFDNLPASIEHIKSGKLRALAVTTASRAPALPDVPVMSDFQPGFEASAWAAFAAPKATPAAVVGKLNAAINAIIAAPAIAARLAGLGGTVFSASPSQLDAYMAGEVDRWGKVARAANIKPM